MLEILQKLLTFISMPDKGKRKNIDDFISRIQHQKTSRPDINELSLQLRNGDKNALSQAITLVESTKSEDIGDAHLLLESCLHLNDEARRIAITGTPGVGKSTFINAFTGHLLKAGHKVAILSIDPTSSISQGSILGDKTRMEDISGLDNVYIRPTATGNTLGGVHQKTREAIILCEAAGYDQILVETVGVGQSEYVVQEMTDLLILMLMPGGGDSLQGIKKGIMEAADIVLINKADQFDIKHIQNSVADYKHAIHLLAAKENGWLTSVLPSSAFDESLINAILETIDQYFNHITIKGFLQLNRKHQWQSWFRESIGWATKEILKQKGFDITTLEVNENELPPAKALNVIQKAIG